jgi:hypothetical protein
MKTFDVKLVRRNIVIITIASIIIANLVIALPNDESRVFFSDWTTNGTSIIAMVLALIVVYRQKLDGLHGVTYASLAVATVLWFIAEMIWTYYELGLGIESPYPSIADIFWLAGYGFAAYHLFRTYRFFRKLFNPYTIVVVSVAIAFILTFVVYTIISISELSTQEDMLLFMVNVAYPVGDVMMIVPAVVVLSGLRKGELTYTPWLLLSTGLLLNGVGDIGFTYNSAAEVVGQTWIWDMFYSDSYICIAAALFWHNTFFIFSRKRATRMWQQENR